jgi:hypothetical protein
MTPSNAETEQKGAEPIHRRPCELRPSGRHTSFGGTLSKFSNARVF